jgi:hypothetical protein
VFAINLVRRLVASLAASLALGAVLPAAAQYDADNFRNGYGREVGNSLFSEQLRREREVAEWRAVAALLGEWRTAFRHRALEPAPAGPTSWRAQNENPWANAYGTPSSSGYGASVRTLPGTSVKMCTCYLPSDARSWDGGPFTQADIARRCQAQCF